MRAAGGTAPRRVLFRAAGLGSLANVVSAQLGVATRIGALRRTAPESTPRVPALVAAEVPIIAVEAMLAALFTFTLVGPLHLPVWIAGARASPARSPGWSRRCAASPAHRDGLWRRPRARCASCAAAGGWSRS